MIVYNKIGIGILNVKSLLSNDVGVRIRESQILFLALLI